MKILYLLRRILCLFNIHSYRTKFIPYDDQPFLTDKVEDESCTIEGHYIYKCKFCNKERPMNF